ncbi:MAG: hypothetical protein ACREMJ_11575 [Gemmatimonadales bacterium]
MNGPKVSSSAAGSWPQPMCTVPVAPTASYGRRWLNKHPSPFDFWNTFEDVAGRDLDWFWRSWWYETWTLDQAVAAVRPTGDSTEIVIEDRSLVPRCGLRQLGGTRCESPGAPKLRGWRSIRRTRSRTWTEGTTGGDAPSPALR